MKHFLALAMAILLSPSLASASNVSIMGVEFNTTSFTFASDTFITGSINKFNTSMAANLTFVSMVNIEKISGGGSNTVSIRVLVDDVIQLEEDLRTTSATGEIGSAKTKPIKFGVSQGQHNLTMEWKRTGNGEINVSNHDMVLLEFVSNADLPIRSNLTNATYTHSSTSFEPAFNFSVNASTGESRMFYIKQTVTGNQLMTLTYFVNQTTNNTRSSGSWIRRLSSIGAVGSILGLYHDNEKASMANYSLMSQTTAGTATVNIGILDFDLADNSSNQVGQFSVSNSSTNITSTLSLGPGVHLVASKSFNITNGTSIFLIAYASIGSSSGSQAPTLIINSSNNTVSNCDIRKTRSLSNNLDIGNVGLMGICNNITAGQVYVFNLFASVEATETMTLFDELLMGHDIVAIDIESINTPPIPREITNPVNGTTFRNLDNVTWNEFLDPLGDNVTYNVSVFNVDGSFNLSINNDTNLTTQLFNTTLPEGVYVLVVEGRDPDGARSNSTSTFTLDNTPPDITILSPLNTTLISTQIVTFSVLVNEDAGAVFMSLDGQANETLVNTSGSWILTNSSIPDGLHNVSFFANDTAGNGNHSAVVFFTTRFQAQHQALIVAQVITGTALLIAFGAIFGALKSLPFTGLRRDRVDLDDIKLIGIIVLAASLILLLMAAFFYADLTQQVVTTISDNPTQGGIG